MTKLINWKRGVLAALAVVGVLVIVAFACRDPIAMKIGYAAAEDGTTPGARFFRDVVLLSVAIVGILIAAWRNRSLDNQSKAANEQARVANKQSETAANQFGLAEKRLLSDQFASAAELMAKETKNAKPAIAARVGGIHIMADLAIKQPEEFAERVVKNLIAHIKDNAKITATPLPEKGKPPAKLRKLGGDVKAAFAVLGDLVVNETTTKYIADKFLDFSQHDFSGLDLRGVNLRYYNYWIETNFRGSNLYMAKFKQDAMLNGADFTGANMQRITFLSGANLQGAIMTEADLFGATMRKIILSHADLRGAILSRANLQGTNLSGAKMHGADMRRVKLNEIGGSGTADLSYARLHGANLADAELQGANMQHAFLWGVDFNAILRDVNLSNAEFVGVDMGYADIYKNELTENVKSAMNGKIIHSGIGDLGFAVDECPEDFDWRLGEYEDSYALNGVLNNFASRDDGISGGVALREQAWKLRHNEKISPKWREWLEKLNTDTWKHPEDIM